VNLRKIKALLIENGIKHKEIARMASVNRVTVSVVLSGKGTSRNIQKTIAKALKMPYKRLWGKAA